MQPPYWSSQPHHHQRHQPFDTTSQAPYAGMEYTAQEEGGYDDYPTNYSGSGTPAFDPFSGVVWVPDPPPPPQRPPQAPVLLTPGSASCYYGPELYFPAGAYVDQEHEGGAGGGGGGDYPTPLTPNNNNNTAVYHHHQNAYSYPYHTTTTLHQPPLYEPAHPPPGRQLETSSAAAAGEPYHQHVDKRARIDPQRYPKQEEDETAGGEISSRRSSLAVEAITAAGGGGGEVDSYFHLRPTNTNSLALHSGGGAAYRLDSRAAGLEDGGGGERGRAQAPFATGSGSSSHHNQGPPPSSLFHQQQQLPHFPSQQQQQNHRAFQARPAQQQQQQQQRPPSSSASSSTTTSSSYRAAAHRPPPVPYSAAAPGSGSASGGAAGAAGSGSGSGGSASTLASATSAASAASANSSLSSMLTATTTSSAGGGGGSSVPRLEDNTQSHSQSHSQQARTRSSFDAGAGGSTSSSSSSRFRSHANSHDKDNEYEHEYGNANTNRDAAMMSQTSSPLAPASGSSATIAASVSAASASKGNGPAAHCSTGGGTESEEGAVTATHQQQQQQHQPESTPCSSSLPPPQQQQQQWKYHQQPSPSHQPQQRQQQQDRPQQQSAPSSQVAKSEKSCKACRIRKVRCSRTWPSCGRCTEKNLECHYGNLIPIDLVRGMHPDSRVAELEARIKLLEHELAMRDSLANVSRDGGRSGSPKVARLSAPERGGAFDPSTMPPPPGPTPGGPPTPRPSFSNSTPSSSFGPFYAPAHDNINEPSRSLPFSSPLLPPPTRTSLGLSTCATPLQVEFGRTAYRTLLHTFWDRLADPEDTTGARRRHVEAVVASAKERAERLRNAKLLRCGGGGESSSHQHHHDRGFGFEIPAERRSKDEAGGPESEEDLFERMAREDLLRVQELKELPIEKLAQNPEWTRIAVWAVLDAHWATCSSNVPTLRPFHVPLRQARLYTRLDSLSPSERCIVLAFCAVGVRSTAYVGLLGLRGGPTMGGAKEAEDGEQEDEEEHLGLKRELVARSFREMMVNMYGRLEIAYGEANKDALEASLILALVSAWNELVPHYSRSLIRTAIAQYKELFDNAAALAQPDDVEAERDDLLMMYALPLLHIDSTTAAYLRAAPIITDSDLEIYFAPFRIPLFRKFDAKDGPGQLDLHEEMRPWMDVDRIGDADHSQHILASMVIYQWVSACLRWCAQMSCPSEIRRPLPPEALETLFGHLSKIHGTIQNMQYHLVQTDGAPHASCLAPSPDGDTADHIHLRWLTRLDRETDDATWLIYSIISERLVREEMEIDDGGMHSTAIKAEDERLDIGWLKACESRVRKGFKLAAFYFNFFTISPDPHQTHHLACSLELIPNWTFLATQRFIPADSNVQQAPYYSGLRSKSDELTETELDWIERGLELAQKYHPVAERRLIEMRSYRLAEKKRLELLAAEGVPVPVSRAGALPPPRLGQKSPLSFQEAMKRALTQTVPSWA
ncbi:hypothetical protein JCM10908_000816 [Rhodotorula pacifica]|uniref:Zn(II)2Cys6 transcription factor domain-containing protein n=1 Tax=Rhodotorula pacifica TaxID=1495444 RepID=UPI003178A9F4